MEQPRKAHEDKAHGYIAKAYDAIFYGTVQYLRAAFGKNIQRPDDENCHERQFNSNNIPRRKESAVLLDDGFKGPVEGETATESMGVKTSRNFHTQSIHNAALRFNQGEFVGLVGNQGAGKTTLLGLLSGRLLCECKQVKGTMR